MGLAGFAARYGPRVVAEGSRRAKTGLQYMKAESSPPGPSDIPQITKEIQAITKGFSAGNFKNVTVKTALVNFCVCFEVMFWFFVGEQLGRWQYIGYVVRAED